MESSTADEEALKRNTDCIYFLASPFTCKKGNECEFRHSEGARVNPRDCWYWMNGNCLNPKCAFRHPPLDGLFGISGAPSGPSPSTFQAGVHVPTAYYSNKQSVPCYYFQKGQCLKGDKCSFMHGPNPSNNNHPAEQASTATHPPKDNDPQQLTSASHSAGNNVLNDGAKNSSWALQECNNVQRTIPKSSADKAAEGPPIDTILPKRSTSPYPLEWQPPRSKIASVSSDSTSSRPHHPQPQPAEEHYSNGREADDFLGESSPGFDVLVDGEEGYRRDSDYYLNEDDYGRNLDQYANDLDYQHPDYEPVTDFERDHQYIEKSDYHRSRSSSERAAGRISKRRLMHREPSPEENNGLDLRHRLLKQRRPNDGLRSIVSSDHHGEPRRGDDHHVEDRRHAPPGSSLSSRLRGRIALPSNEPVELQSERGTAMGRLSRRPQDRISRRPNDEFNAEGRRSFRVPNRRDGGGKEDPLNFAGPKSLAELKGAKVLQTPAQNQPIKSIVAPLAHRSTGASLSFEGPKPLGDILKRKRERGDESNGKNVSARSDTLGGADKEVGEDNRISTEGENLPFVGHSSFGDNDMPEDATEDQELDNFGSKYGDSEYEATEGEKFKSRDDDDADLDDEDDEEDFAKKVGGFFS